MPKTFQGKLILFKAIEGDDGETPAGKKTYEPLFGWDKRATEGVELSHSPKFYLGDSGWELQLACNPIDLSG